MESLSNEIFCEIFEYLDGYEMLKAFSNLNHRFQILIHHPSIQLNLKHCNQDPLSIGNYYRQIIEPNRARLRSLHLICGQHSPRRFDYIMMDASFSRLESLRLDDMSLDKLMMYCFYSNFLPNLHSLNICTDVSKNSSAMGNILRMILSLPSLKRCIVSNNMNFRRVMLNRLLPNAINSKPSTIEYLKIDKAVSLEILLSLLKDLPELRHLEYFSLPRSIGNRFRCDLIDLSHLKQISIDAAAISFDQCEALIEIIGRHVEIFKLLRDKDENYLDAERWERIITNYLPHLRVFDMKYVDTTLWEIKLIDPSFDLFHSQFWIERKWFPTVTFGLFSSEFHIHPYK